MLTSSEKWDNRFLDLCDHVASWSKDLSRKVGCVLVGDQREVLSTGYNGLPRGADDGELARFERPTKYAWTEHAERNAIYNAARIGSRILGCTAYINLFPCADCARALIQSGVKRIVTREPENWEHPYLNFEVSKQMLEECGVEVVVKYRRK